MELRKLLEKEFTELNSKLDSNKTVTLSPNSLNVSGFEETLEEYRKSIDKAYRGFVSKKEESVKKYESGLNAKVLFGKKDVIYQSALVSFNNKKYIEAKMSFDSILDFKDSKDLSLECEKYLEIEYDKALAIFNSKQFEDALVHFKSLNPYKNSTDLIKQCEIELEKIAKNKKQEERLNLASAKKKKKKRLIAIISSSVAAIVALALILTFALFIPGANKSKINSAIQLINSGQYSAAISELESFNYGDSQNQLNVAKAGIAFKDGKIEEGIEYMCDAGGTTEVGYDLKGGSASKTSATVKKASDFTNNCTKEYYNFDKWNISNFDIQTAVSSYSCSLSVFASYSTKVYNITYVLNGGTNNSSNPSSYTYESAAITLKEPNKTGYAFAGWTCNGSSQNTIPVHSSGDLTFKAGWNANTYHVTLDANGGTYTGSSSYDVVFNGSCSFPTPTREYYKFVDWYYNDTKVGNTWTIASNCTIVAKWELAILSELVYSVKYSEYDGSRYISVSGLKSTFTGTGLIIPSTIDGYPVRDIETEAFKGYSNASTIEYVEFPSTVTHIGGACLSGFTNLKKISLPFAGEYDASTDGSNTIFGFIFGTDNANTTQKWQKGYSTYGSSGMTWEEIDYFIPTTLTEVELTSTTTLTPGEFSNCLYIKKIVLPNSATTIFNYSFSTCTALQSVKLGNSIEKIYANAFRECPNLNDISLPNSVKTIGDSAFYQCSFSTISLGSNLTSLGSAAFMSNISLTSLVIPSGVTYLNARLCYGCSALESVSIQGKVTYWDSEVFKGCSFLASVTIASGVTQIGDKAFSSCTSLESISIPFSVKTLGSDVFSYASNFKDVYYSGTQSQWNSVSKDYFWDQNMNSITIHCSDGDISH